MDPEPRAFSKPATVAKTLLFETMKEKNEYDFAMINEYPGIGNKRNTDSVVSIYNSLILMK